MLRLFYIIISFRSLEHTWNIFAQNSLILNIKFLSVDKHQAGTYQDLVRHLLGNRAKQFVQTCIVVYFMGTCITYVIIIGEQLASLLQAATGKESGKESGKSGNIFTTTEEVCFGVFTLSVKKKSAESD